MDIRLNDLENFLAVASCRTLSEGAKKRGITARYYVDGGFVQIRQNAVTVLTQKAIKGEEIQIPAAEAALKAAQTPAADAGTQEARLKAQQRARAQIRVAHHATDKPGLSLEGH